MTDKEIKEISKVNEQLLDKIENILATELNEEEYDKFYNYFNEIRKPNIIVDIKDDENIKELINQLQSNWNSLKEYCEENKYFYSGFQGEDREEDLSIKDVLDKMNELEKDDDNA